MSILSLGRYLNATEDRMRELMVLLLSGIRLHAIGQDESRRTEFQSELARIEERLAGDLKVEAISLLVGQAIHCIDSYHRSVDLGVQTALTEYKQLAVVLTQTIGRIAGGNENSLQKLRSIEKQMGAVNSVADIRLLRHDLAGCLTELCDKTIQYRENATRLVSSLQSRLKESASPRLPNVGTLPHAASAAGLPGRAEAMDCIRQATEAQTCSYAAVLLLDRFPLMSKRFGIAMVDQLQTFASIEIAQRLQPADQMFQWIPGGFVVVMERTEPSEHVKAELKQLSAIRAAKAIEVDDRSVILPVSISFCLFPLFQASSVEAVQKDIDAFIRAHSEA